MTTPQSQIIREQLAEHENARAHALHSLEELAVRRPALLLGPSDRAGDRALTDHDAAAAREHRAIERADAHLAELRPALARAEAAEREKAVAELYQHGVDLSAEYRRVADTEYVLAARAVAEVMQRLDRMRFDIERIAAALPTGRQLPPIEAWRRQPDSPWRLASLPEGVRLPALRQGARPIWDADFRQPAFRRDVTSLPQQPQAVWDPTKPIRFERPDYERRMAEIEQRAEAERRAQNLFP